MEKKTTLQFNWQLVIATKKLKSIKVMAILFYLHKVAIV